MHFKNMLQVWSGIVTRKNFSLGKNTDVSQGVTTAGCCPRLTCPKTKCSRIKLVVIFNYCKECPTQNHINRASLGRWWYIQLLSSCLTDYAISVQPITVIYQLGHCSGKHFPFWRSPKYTKICSFILQGWTVVTITPVRISAPTPFTLG